MPKSAQRALLMSSDGDVLHCEAPIEEKLGSGWTRPSPTLSWVSVDLLAAGRSCAQAYAASPDAHRGQPTLQK